MEGKERLGRETASQRLGEDTEEASSEECDCLQLSEEDRSGGGQPERLPQRSQRKEEGRLQNLHGRMGSRIAN